MRKTCLVCLVCLSVSTLCVLPIGAYAEEDEGFFLEPLEDGEEDEKADVQTTKGEDYVVTGDLEIGAGFNTVDSFKFGEYTGLVEEEPFGIGNLRLQIREAFDSDTAYYGKFLGTNLGLENRYIRVEQGNQGRYDVFFDYDQIPHYQAGFPSDTALTPYNGVGTGRLTLPGDWTAATTTGGMTSLRESLKTVEMKTERKRFGGGVTWHLDPRWAVEATFRHERKDGLDVIAGAFGTNGGNPSAIILPQPIDYKTDTVNVSLGYAGPKAQFQLGYELSLFNNEEPSLLFQNPYSGNGRGGPWDPATGFPTGFGEMALPPDNQSHRVTLSGGYNVGDTTRLTANVSYNRMQQDERFRNFSAIPALNASVTTPLPRDSLNGRIDNWLVDFGVSSRPLPKLDLRANYRYENRDNNTPRDIYVRIRGDAQTQPGGITNDNARINLPYSLEQHKASLDVGYRILPSTKLTLGYDWLEQERDFQERDEIREHTVRGKVAVTPAPYANGWVEYAHGFRGGSSYLDNAAFLGSHTDPFLDSLDPNERFENHPALRKYFLAKRDRDMVRGMVTFIPVETMTLSFDGSFIRDNYREAELGLQESRIASATVNLTYSPTRDITGFAFFTYNNLFYDQRGHQFNAAGLPSLTAPGQRWSIETEDEVLTPGFGLNWAIIRDRLDFGVDYSVSLAKTRIDPTLGSALITAPLTIDDTEMPDIDTRFYRLNAKLSYKVKDNLSLRFLYRYEILRTRDFARDDLAIDSLPFVLTMGTTSPDYTAHLFGLTVDYRF